MYRTRTFLSRPSLHLLAFLVASISSMPRPELHACIEVIAPGVRGERVKLPGVRGEFARAVWDPRGTFKSDNKAKTVASPVAGSVFLDQRAPMRALSRAVTPQHTSTPGTPPPLGQPRYNNGSPAFIPSTYTVPETWQIHRQEHIMGE